MFWLGDRRNKNKCSKAFKFLNIRIDYYIRRTIQIIFILYEYVVC